MLKTLAGKSRRVGQSVSSTRNLANMPALLTSTSSAPLGVEPLNISPPAPSPTSACNATASLPVSRISSTTSAPLRAAIIVHADLITRAARHPCDLRTDATGGTGDQHHGLFHSGSIPASFVSLRPLADLGNDEFLQLIRRHRHRRQPDVASFSLTSAVASALVVAAYSLSTIALGVPAGAAITNQAVMS